MSFPEPIPTLTDEEAEEFLKRLENFKLSKDQKEFYKKAKEIFDKHKNDDLKTADEYEKRIAEVHHEFMMLIADYSSKFPAEYMMSRWV